MDYPSLRLTPAQLAAAKELGRIGGKTRAANLSPEERRRIASKAAKASAKVRTLKAKQRKEAARKVSQERATADTKIGKACRAPVIVIED
jgi:hypothetical protein